MCVDWVMVEDSKLNGVAKALAGGVVLLDADGEIVWMDRAARRHMSGEQRGLSLPLLQAGDKAVDCLVAPVEFSRNGEPVNICVMRPADAAAKEKDGQDLIAALETIMADSASWFSRTVVERFRAIGRPGTPSNDVGHHRQGVERLSDRECEVLGLICEGKSGAHIGMILGLSENTVRNHIASLYRKIGVNRRSAAIIWARERGIVSRETLGLGRVRRRERATASVR